jgi:hypothetical protein
MQLRVMKRRRGAIGRRVLQIAAVCGKRDIRVCFWEQFFMSGPKYFTAYQFAATDVKSGKRHAIGTSVAAEIRNGKVVLGATS